MTTTDALEAISEATTYYLQNNMAGYVGNSPMFWREGNCGYTPWLDEAKRFSAEEADEIISRHTGSHKFTKWPTNQVDTLSRRTVDIQDLRR